MNRSLTRLAFVVLVLWPLAAGPAQSPAFFVDEAVVDFPDSLDPHHSFFPGWDRFHRCAYETPVVCDSQGETLRLLPRLLTELPEVSEDGRTLTLRFRSGVRFHDDPCFPEGRGRDLTADDFVFTLMRHADPAMKSVFWTPYLAGRIVGLDALRLAAEKSGRFDFDAACEGIRKRSPLELELVFVAPYPQFTALLSMAWASVLPREAERRYGSGLGARTVGTGPYVFDAEASNADLRVYRKAAEYWNAAADGEADPLPRNDGVRFWRLTDLALHDKRFLDRDLELLDVDIESRRRLLNPQGRPLGKVTSRGTQVQRTDLCWLHYLTFNTENRFFADKRVRQAFCLAIDRERIIREVFSGDAVLANHVVPPSLPLDTPQEPLPWKYGRRDLDAAKVLLAEAGFPEGKGMPEFLVEVGSDSESVRLELEIIRKNLERIGVKVQTRCRPFAEYMQRLIHGQQEIALHYWFADYPDCENFFSMLDSASIPRPDTTMDLPNVGRWRNADYDRLHARSSLLAPGRRRGILLQEMIALIQEECPWVLIAHQQKPTLVQPGLEGIGSRNAFAVDYTRIRMKKK